MGYFSNGSEGLDWEERNCRGCVHDPANDSERGCPILMLHVEWNYDQLKPEHKDAKAILDVLIPEKGIFNGTCAMRHVAGEAKP